MIVIYTFLRVPQTAEPYGVIFQGWMAKASSHTSTTTAVSRHTDQTRALTLPKRD
jgi:hypothetical protein